MKKKRRAAPLEGARHRCSVHLRERVVQGEVKRRCGFTRVDKVDVGG